MIKRSIAVAILLLVSQWPRAEDSPVGLWKTIDDNTHQSRSIVRIFEENGEYKGVIEKGLDANESPDRVCDKCAPPRKGQKILGMNFMWGLKKVANEYKGGEILDPDNGKIYRCKMSLSDDGKTLNVRGFIGISLLGRTQVWLREQ